MTASRRNESSEPSSNPNDAPTAERSSAPKASWRNPPPSFSSSSPSATAARSSLLENCDRPVCDDMVSMMQQAQQQLIDQKGESRATTPGPIQKATAQQPVECPPNSAALGRASWTLLHSMAAWFPEEPSEQDRLYMGQFMTALARFYPCPWCADDFQSNLQRQPVQTASRKELCQWLCQQHNLVNQKLGKPLFSCDMKHLDDRWRKSHRPECSKSSH